MEKVEVRDSGKKGKGLFALQNIKKGEEILYISGKVVEVEDESVYSEHVREHWHPIDKKGGKVVYVLPEPPWMYLNHSCEPNAGLNYDRHLVATNDISKGEEINIDYSTLFPVGWSMKCECGNKICRKTISTFDTLSPGDQARLRDYISSYVRKEYLENL